MARHLGKQGEWPKVQGNPDAFVVTPDGYQKCDRSLAGPLRLGTAEGVGPRGRAIVAENSERTDMGMDRVSPREFDPMGTSLNRYSGVSSDLVSREIRGRRPRDRE
jgi:hypothetical protein